MNFAWKEGKLIIEFIDICKSFTSEDMNVRALYNINFSINDHEIFGIIGESGSGKSTLLRMINRLETPDHGSVLLDNVDMSKLTKNELRIKRKDIGMVFQQFNLLKNKTVYQNVALPLKMINKKDDGFVDEVLSFVGLMHKKTMYPSKLSGGEQQRVAIARALVTRPSLLLCDEPSSSLDTRTTDELIRVLRSINKNFNTTIVIVTHQLDVIKKLCERAAIMKDGIIQSIVNIPQVNLAESKSTYMEQVMEVLNS